MKLNVKKYTIAFVAVSWSLFQLSIASWLILDSIYIRSIHLAFALFIAFLATSEIKSIRGTRKERFGGIGSRIFQFCLASAAAGAALYIALDYAGIAARCGVPIGRDIVIGVLLILLLFEACRRWTGPALPIIAGLFCIYSFLGPHMPAIIAFRGVSLDRFIGQMTMSTEGVYGVPLRVSASVVFLFVLFGAMLKTAGGGEFFTNMALSMLGRYRGGPAKAAVLSSGLTGMVSGSSIANVVTTGTFTIPLMEKVGYPRIKAAAIEVAASTDGQLAPPIMGAAAFIIAEYVNVPYIAVVKAAAIPAFAAYVTLFYIAHLEACKLGLEGMKKEDTPCWQTVFTQGWYFLVPLVFLIYQLIILRKTPETAAFHAVAVMTLIMVVQRPVMAFRRREPLRPALKRGFLDVFDSLVSGARAMVPVALATAGAGIIVGVVSMGLGGLITQIIHTLSGGHIMTMLILTALASMVIGMGLPTTATYITMASLTAPVIVAVAGAENFAVPLMAAHLFCFYFGILADDTPPVGLAAYAAAAIAKSPPIATGVQGFMYDLRTAILPFAFIFNTDLILHNIDNLWQGLLIFVMTCAGTAALASATLGWFATKNRIFDIFALLIASFLLLLPGIVAPWIGIPHSLRYWVYPLGLILLVGLHIIQKRRVRFSTLT